MTTTAILQAALADTTTLPALRDAHTRLTCALENPSPSSSAIVDAIESDVALTFAVICASNRDGMQTDNVPAAVRMLGLDAVKLIAREIEVSGPLDRAVPWNLRFHASQVRRIVARLASILGYESSLDRLVAAAVLHDIGKVTLARQSTQTYAKINRPLYSPEQRLGLEQRELSADHALIGATVLRRAGAPARLVELVSAHHRACAGESGVLRLADMLAHALSGAAVSSQALVDLAAQLGLAQQEIETLMFDLQRPVTAGPRTVEPCPLTRRELDMLRLLAEGKRYKEIGQAAGVSTSTVRSHLHNVYGKLGVVDRAQAVMHATRRGWVSDAPLLTTA